ncbi:MAG: hypothetical protein K9J13_04410 [Saprospiraceae bacterium]|nr:hypothetical protein [Saprospiraceae bacterium]
MTKGTQILIVILLSGNLSYSQNANIPKDKSELFRLERIKDRIIVEEIKPLLYNYSGDTLAVNMIQIPLVDTNDFYSTFCRNGIEIMINSEYFYPQLHSISYDSILKTHNVKKIDGKVFWGTHDELPNTKVHKIKLRINGVNIPIPDSATDGLYNPNFGCNNVDCYNFVYQSLDKKRIYIIMNNSDGAGFYQIVWIIKDNKYYGKLIDLGP